MRSVQIKVYGQVQCVGFRYHVFTIAQQIGLTGWVKNMSDGSVEILVEGTDEQIEVFVPYVKEGPRFARVDELIMIELESVKTTYSFTIM